VLLLIGQDKHLTLGGFTEIVEIASEMNSTAKHHSKTKILDSLRK